MTTVTNDHAVLVSGPSIDDREARLAEGADELAGRRTSVLGNRNALVVASAALMTTGLTAILLAWFGASRSTLIEEQVPYLISGGLLGVALSVIGALAFFAHWLTVLIGELRAQEAARARDHAELLEALRSLRHQGGTDGTARGSQRERPLRGAPGGP